MTPQGTSALDRVRIAKLVRAFLDKRRPPPSVREKLDYGFRFYDQSVELFTIRPKWRRPGKAEHSFAKATFIKSRGVWKIFWMRANLKWHRYEPAEAQSLEEFLRIVGKDENGCFFG